MRIDRFRLVVLLAMFAFLPMAPRPSLAQQPEPPKPLPTEPPTPKTGDNGTKPESEKPAEPEPAAEPPKPPQTGVPKGSGKGPKILSARETADYLRLPGASQENRYREPIDWRLVPAWRQTQFFGVRAEGQVFVFVVDCSGSMSDGFRLTRARQELRRCIANLRFPQRYHVIFYNDDAWPMPGGMPQPPEQATLRRTFAWMQAIDAEGGTDPKRAMDLALGYRPDAVFLLSDGEFPEGTDRAVAAQNTRSIPIHGIDLSGGRAGDQLRTIAEQSGGEYAARP